MEAAISCKFHCSRLEHHWRGHWPAADIDAMAADVMRRQAAAARAWGLEDVAPLDGGVVALTCAAVRHGRPMVLKLNPRGHRDDAQLAAEGEALEHWRSTGAAVELLDRRDRGFTLLLERLEPGQPLDESRLSAEDRLAELGRLVARLHAAGPPPSSFMHVRDFAPVWELPEGGEEVLTHLDLHGGNALSTASGWRAIDPKGVRADRHADVWALIDPLALESLPEDPGAARRTAERRLRVYSGAAGMDPAKAREWTRIRARAEVREGAEPAWAERLTRMAEALG
jgi:streptomycin 6-kinase